MNWCGRRFAPGAGSALSAFEIYIYNILKDARPPVRYYRYITYLKTPLGTYLFGILCLLVNCFLNIITFNILCFVGKWVGYLYASYNNTGWLVRCSQLFLLRHFILLFENLGLITYHGIQGFLVRCSQQMIIYKTFYFVIGEPWFNNLPLNARFLGSLFSTNDYL